MKPKQTHPLNERTGKLRSASMRKLAKDGTSWTPTEKLKRNRLMKQFAKHGRKGYEVSSGNSEAYRAGYDLIDWGEK